MSKVSHMVAAAVGTTVLAAACAKVPFTDRRQFNVVPTSIMQGLGKSSYASTLGSVKVEKKGEDVTTLRRVGSRISKVAKEPKFAWEFNLIEEDTINAWCLPGGYIGFYTGILPALENEAGMAFVMGHEVGHATANHGAERMSQQLTLLGGLAGLELYLANKTKLSTEQQVVLMGAIGLGAEVGAILPFSRLHESEADVIGMMYMAEAGYPPQESVKVWERMEKIAGASTMPAFLSTHPSNDKRIAHQKEWMGQANKVYTRNKLTGNLQAPLWTAQ
jgi:predicted Zn-dependent protease